MRVVHGPRFQHLPPIRDRLLNSFTPCPVFLWIQQWNESFERLFGVASETDIGGITKTQHSLVNINLDASRLSFLGKKLRIRKTRAYHKQSIAVLHQIPTRLSAEQTDGPSHKRQTIRQHRAT